MSNTNRSKQGSLITGPVLHALRSFSAAATHCSFTRAADELHVTQGAISQQVRLLEDRLGLCLFLRHARGLSLTVAGARLAAAMDEALRGLSTTVAELKEQQLNRLTISCSPSFAMMWLIPRLGKFSQIHPVVQLRIIADYLNVDSKSLGSNTVDLAIRYDLGEDFGVPSVDLMDEYLLPVASPGFVQSHPALEDPNAMATITLLHDASPWDGAPPYAEWCDWLDKAAGDLGIDRSKVSGRSGHQFNLSQLALSAAMNDQGIAMGRAALVWSDMETGHLVDMFSAARKANARYRILMREDVAAGEVSQMFISWLLAECGSFRQIRDLRMERMERRSAHRAD